MADTDKERWNQKYKLHNAPITPIALLSEHIHRVKGTHALDVACGMGRHAKFMASHGLAVDALDISDIAINTFNNETSIQAKCVDFDTYILEENHYDLIVCSFYLERKLFPQFVKSLKKDGLLLFETFVYDKDSKHAPSNPLFILQEGELEAYFSKVLHIISIKEWWDIDEVGDRTKKVSMVASKM